MDAETLLWSYRELVDRRLGELLPSDTFSPSELHQAMRYSGLAPGKRLRPALCIASGEAFGGDRAKLVDLGCALELVHAFSLIHDDLPAIDNDDLRRGRPTCHIKFGEAIAILAGDALFSLAFKIVSEIDAPASIVLSCVKELAIASGSEGLVGGEVLDVLAEGKPVSEEQIQEIHNRKTAALIAASCVMGATLSGADHNEQESFRRFGMGIGLAFQIADDVLNETSTPEALGKATGSDRDRNKATYPAIMGLAEAKELARATVQDALTELPESQRNSSAINALAWYAIERLN